MSRKEFFETLAKIAKKTGWRVTLGELGKLGKVRIVLFFGGRSFCPITAVCYEKTGIFVKEISFLSAAKEIGLRDPGIIVDAADTGFNYPRVRQKLLRTLGLSKDKAT